MVKPVSLQSFVQIDLLLRKLIVVENFVWKILWSILKTHCILISMYIVWRYILLCPYHDNKKQQQNQRFRYWFFRTWYRVFITLNSWKIKKTGPNSIIQMELPVRYILFLYFMENSNTTLQPNLITFKLWFFSVWTKPMLVGPNPLIRSCQWNSFPMRFIQEFAHTGT